MWATGTPTDSTVTLPKGCFSAPVLAHGLGCLDKV